MWDLVEKPQDWFSHNEAHIFMTKSSQENVPDAGIYLGTACISRGIAADRAAVSGGQE